MTYTDMAHAVADLVRSGTAKRAAIAAALRVAPVHAAHAIHTAVRLGLVKYRRATDSYVTAS